ncbi:MAG: RDD family protein [Elusimicrobia bacterium]|nr:RDD family protein [Elusimicrobiota bacterium]
MDAQKPDNSITPPADINPELAGFWIRLSAFILDFVCVWIPCIWLATILKEYLAAYHIFALYGGNDFFVVIFMTFSYHALTLGRWGQTLGKFLASILVVEKNGGKISYLRSLGRTLLWYLSMYLLLRGCVSPFDTGTPLVGLLLVLGCLWLGVFLQSRIFFYDYICGTRVVCKKPIGHLHKTTILVFGFAVVIIVGCLSILPPSRNIEKSRAEGALSYISIIKSAQAKYYTRHNAYADKFTMLDLSFPEMTATKIHTTRFIVTISISGCGKAPCYILTATRHTKNTTVAARYGLYSLNVIVPDRPQVQILSCPGGYGNCAELIR